MDEARAGLEPAPVTLGDLCSVRSPLDVLAKTRRPSLGAISHAAGLRTPLRDGGPTQKRWRGRFPGGSAGSRRAGGSAMARFRPMARDDARARSLRTLHGVERRVSVLP